MMTDEERAEITRMESEIDELNERLADFALEHFGPPKELTFEKIAGLPTDALATFGRWQLEGSLRMHKLKLYVQSSTASNARKLFQELMELTLDPELEITMVDMSK